MVRARAAQYTIKGFPPSTILRYIHAMAESELFSFNTGGKKPSLRPGDKDASSSLASKSHTINSDSEGGSSSVGSGYSSDEDRKQTKRK